tara:strand:- start:137 stop:352 length:216 start_codon:yes stop_codon:yes gene_type:complete
MCYIIRIESERLKMMKKESIFQVTFTNKSSVFIKAFDHDHAMRIVQRNGSTWTRADDSVEMVIEKIEKVNG